MKPGLQLSGAATEAIWCMPQLNLRNDTARKGSSLCNSVSPCLCGDESASFTTETRRHRLAQRNCRFVTKSLIALVLLLSNQCFRAAAQTPTTSPTRTTSDAQISEIKKYTTQVDRFSKARKFRTFGVFYKGDKGSWRELKGKSDQQLDESCDVWTRDGKVVLAFFGFTSGSGDWYHFIKYYYREDGTLAKIQARLNTFYGNVSVLRDRYYDANGKLLKSTRRYLDIETHKPVKKANFHDDQIPMFSKASALPFFRLL
jgi:hypothetical protein